MIAVTNRLHVAAEYATTLEQSFAETLDLVTQEPGFIRNLVLRPTREKDPYVILTFWESREHFTTWTQSESFKQSHKGRVPKEAFTAPNELEIHEVVLDSTEQQ